LTGIAPGVLRKQRVATTTTVVGGRAANGDTHAGLVGHTERESWLVAYAVAAVVKVIAVWLSVSVLGCLAPGEVSSGGDAVTAAVVSEAT